MIRKYEETDLEGLLDVWYQASLVAHPFLGEDFFTQERENIRTVYMPVTETWVYEDAGRVVGFISLLDNEVGGIFVYPSWQGKGVGRSLMDKAGESHSTLELEVYAENKNARRFYERYGFVAFKEFPHEETGRSLLRMRLEK